MMSQRFFFQDPTDVIQDLAESILDLDDDVETELFSGTLGVLFNFDVQKYISELSSGWTGGINTERLETKASSNPDEAVKTIQQSIEPSIPDASPNEINMAVSHFIGLIFADTRTARDYYKRFGKTAQKYGLEEEPFCNWLDELHGLIDDLNPDLESTEDAQPDKFKQGFESLNSEIRTRIDLQEHLEENHSQAQQKLQQRLEKIRNKPDEIANQYIRCGKQLEETENPIFPFIWYAVGHEMFSKIVLGGENREIFAEFNRLLGTRERQEDDIDDDEMVISAESVTSILKKSE